jgi:hypothetical protein
MEYEFTLKFRIPTIDSKVEEIVECLGGSCNDAVVGIGEPGRLALNFTRASNSAELAILGAVTDVKNVVREATLIEITPDFVSLADIAEHIGVSRQKMRKILLAHPNSFPAPVHEGITAIWHLVSVLSWLKGRDGYRIRRSLFDVAQTAMHINTTRDRKQIERRRQRAVIESVE